MINVAIFASGNGSNALRLCEQFRAHPKICIALIITDNPQAGVIRVAAHSGVPCKKITREELRQAAPVSAILSESKIEFIILAGFLRLIPREIIHDFPQRMINIHPALLPAYGGKGMYGAHVHKAVLQNREKESGISIHYVNEHYDEGDVIFQASCAVSSHDTPGTLAEKIHALEYLHFPTVAEQVITRTFCLPGL